MLRNRYLPLAMMAGLFILTYAEASSQTLKSIGTLNCEASKGDTDGRALSMTALDCRLELSENPRQKASVVGRLYGTALALRKPDDTRVVWRVFAPDAAIDPKQFEGDYDIESRVNFELPDDRAQMLVGGSGGTVALQLVQPELDAVDPSTRLTLNVTIPGQNDGLNR
jgi:hypothetical protein